MERKGITIALVCAGIWTGMIPSSAAEKIKFSTPSESSGIASEERTLPKSSPNLFDKFRNGGADALSMPMPQPQNRAPQREVDDKKDWIFGKPDDRTGVEDRFKKKGNEERRPGTTGLARYVEGVERQEAQSQVLKFRDNPQNQDQEDLSFSDRDRDGVSAFANPNRNLNLEKFEKENFSFSDYWKETTGMNPDRFEAQADLRRAEFQQIFEPRSALTENSALDELRQNQQGNVQVSAPTDFSSRTSQSSVSDSYGNGYMPMTGSRTTVFDDVNSRALGRDSSSPLNTVVERPRVQSQPAILPFPSRPGDLFKRPGNY